MRWLLVIVIYSMAGVLGVSFKRYFGDIMFYPDIVAIALFYFCFFEDPKKYHVKTREVFCLINGFIAGFVCDCFSLNILGFGILTYGLFGLLCSNILGNKRSGFLVDASCVLFFSFFLYVMMIALNSIIYKKFYLNDFMEAIILAFINAVVYITFDMVISAGKKVLNQYET